MLWVGGRRKDWTTGGEVMVMVVEDGGGGRISVEPVNGSILTSRDFAITLFTVSEYVSPPAASDSIRVSFTSKCRVRGLWYLFRCFPSCAKYDVGMFGSTSGRVRDRTVRRGEGVGREERSVEV